MTFPCISCDPESGRLLRPVLLVKQTCLKFFPYACGRAEESSGPANALTSLPLFCGVLFRMSASLDHHARFMLLETCQAISTKTGRQG